MAVWWSTADDFEREGTGPQFHATFELGHHGVEPYRFGDGGCLLWDDTYMHEVLNASDQPRIALLLDVWRPQMPPSLEFVSRAIAGSVRLAMRVKGPSYGG